MSIYNIINRIFPKFRAAPMSLLFALHNILLRNGKFYLLSGNLLWKPPVKSPNAARLHKKASQASACRHTCIQSICLTGFPFKHRINNQLQTANEVLMNGIMTTSAFLGGETLPTMDPFTGSWPWKMVVK